MTERSQPAWPKAALFDLDGTLIDSAPDIAAAVNELLGGLGHAPLPVDAVRGMIGNGVRKLVERALAARGHATDPAEVDRQHAVMMPIYARHLTRLTVLMPHAAETLGRLAEAGVRLAVVTNKPEAFTREILEHFELSPMISAVLGGDSGPARKPAPDMLLAVLAGFDVPPADAVMVGDSQADVEAARAAGVASVLVRGGYSAAPAETLGANLVVESLGAVPDALASLRLGA